MHQITDISILMSSVKGLWSNIQKELEWNHCSFRLKESVVGSTFQHLFRDSSKVHEEHLRIMWGNIIQPAAALAELVVEMH